MNPISRNPWSVPESACLPWKFAHLNDSNSRSYALWLKINLLFRIMDPFKRKYPAQIKLCWNAMDHDIPWSEKDFISSRQPQPGSNSIFQKFTNVRISHLGLLNRNGYFGKRANRHRLLEFIVSVRQHRRRNREEGRGQPPPPTNNFVGGQNIHCPLPQ